jgi:DNA-directed RNA polymerase subunit RPC12/RpoP
MVQAFGWCDKCGADLGKGDEDQILCGNCRRRVLQRKLRTAEKEYATTSDRLCAERAYQEIREIENRLSEVAS